MTKNTPENNEFKTLPENDYVSPGFETILLDKHFPHMIKVTDPNLLSQMEILETREMCHNHYADSREPGCGFVNRDEAHILYNTALRYSDRPALEIGCWMGWSAAHLLAGGIALDVIDPVLGREDFQQSVFGSLNSAGLLEKAVFWDASYGSPNLVDEISRYYDGKKWSLIFIDGNHEAPAPLVDAFICSRHANDDCLILFHDLWKDSVVDALDYMKDQGWNTMIYHTFAIMGVAWRGNMQPVEHIPDPTTSWTIPANLREYKVSGH